MAGNLLRGFLCVLLRPISEYAKFVVVYVVQGSLVVLMNVGIAGSLMPLVGERVNDRQWIADLIASLRQLGIGCSPLWPPSQCWFARSWRAIGTGVGRLSHLWRRFCWFQSGLHGLAVHIARRWPAGDRPNVRLPQCISMASRRQIRRPSLRIFQGHDLQFHAACQWRNEQRQCCSTV
jgi:hypothetical protein